MEELLRQLLKEVQEIKADLGGVETRLSAIEADMATKSQQDENSRFIQALLHPTEELDAKVDSIVINTASKESIADLDAKFEVLNKRLFQQEADMLRLKKAQ